MTWGCKHKLDGCGWATRTDLPTLGQQEWWCDLCERSGEIAIPIVPVVEGAPCPYTGLEPHDCHLGPCDCFDDIGCERCAALPPFQDPHPDETGEEMVARLLASHGHPGEQCRVGEIDGEFTTCIQCRETTVRPPNPTGETA